MRRVERVTVGGLRLALRPGQSARVACTQRGSVSVPYSVRPVHWDSLGRPVGVQASRIEATDIGAAEAGSSPSTPCRLVGS
jgi:hypothetical protein